MKKTALIAFTALSISSVGYSQVAVDGEFTAEVTNSTAGGFQPDTGFDHWNNLLPVNGGASVTTTFWARSTTVHPSRLLKATIAFFESQSPEGTGVGHLGDFNIASDISVPLEWRPYSGTFTAPQTANFFVVSFRVDGGGIPPHTVEFDNVTVTDNSTIPPTEFAVPNPSFEIWPDPATSAPEDWRFFAVADATGSIQRGENPPAATSATQTLSQIFKRDSVEASTDPADWFTTDANTRGMAFNPLTNHLLVVDRSSNTAGTIQVINATDGSDIGQLNTTGIDPAGSTFVINKVGVDNTGRIFVANLARTGQTFRIYMYQSEAAGLLSGPTLVYSLPVVAENGGRFGDDMAVTGGGATTRIIVSGRGPDRIIALEDNGGTLTGVDYSVPGLNSASNVAFTPDPDVYAWHRSLGFFNSAQTPDYANVSLPVYSVNFADGSPAGIDPYELNVPHATGPFDIAQLVTTSMTLLAVGPAEAEYTTGTFDVAGYGYDFEDNTDIPFKTGGLERADGFWPNGNGTGDVVIDPVGNRVFYLVTSNSISGWNLPLASRVDNWMLF